MNSSAAAARTPFGGALKLARGLHGMSQLTLALEAGVSARHVSFIESGCSQPSRPMVLRLAEALELPLRESNMLLNAPVTRRITARAGWKTPPWHRRGAFLK